MVALVTIAMQDGPLPQLPNLTEYGALGVLLLALLWVCLLLWKRLGKREEELRVMADNHNRSLIALIEKSNTVMGGVESALNRLSDRIDHLGWTDDRRDRPHS